MIALRLFKAPAHSGRVEKALYYRCRRGQKEALTALAHRLMDRLYTGAMYVAPDETTAATAALLAWEDTLALLARPYVGGYLHQRAKQQLAKRLQAFAPRGYIRQALTKAFFESEDALLPIPDQAKQNMLELASHYAPIIAQAYQERRQWRRHILGTITTAIVLIALYQIWLVLKPRWTKPEIQLQCLQQRILKGDLIDSLQQMIAELPDPSGADRWQALMLQQASLALEEIINASHRQSLRYLVVRLQNSQLSEEIGEIAQDCEEPARSALRAVQLILEETQAL